MLTIDTNGNIKVNKGDTFIIPLFIDCGCNKFLSTRFKLKEGDIIYFRLMEPNMFFFSNRAVVKKEFTIEDENDKGDILIKFEHTDTCYLPSSTYYYEIKLARPKEEDSSEDSDDDTEDLIHYPKDKQNDNSWWITIVPRRKFILID